MRQAHTKHEHSQKSLISVGSNLKSSWGDSTEAVQKSRLILQQSLKTDVVMSRLYSTPAFPAGSGPDFVNAVFAFEADIAPDALLTLLHNIEKEAERERNVRWGPRTLDLDLIACGDAILPDLAVWTDWYDLAPDRQTEVAPDRLILPHPRMHERAFVLVPLADVAPTWVHPVLELSVADMLDGCFGEDLASVVPLT